MGGRGEVGFGGSGGQKAVVVCDAGGGRGRRPCQCQDGTHVVRGASPGADACGTAESEPAGTCVYTQPPPHRVVFVGRGAVEPCVESNSGQRWGESMIVNWWKSGGGRGGGGRKESTVDCMIGVVATARGGVPAASACTQGRPHGDNTTTVG